MKRLAAAFVLIAAAVAITVCTGYFFDREMDFFEKSLSRLVDISAVSTDEALLDEAKRLERRWSEASGLLRSVVLHEGIDELGRSVSSLPRLIEYSGREEMITECIEAINLIKNLKSCEKLSIENVL